MSYTSAGFENCAGFVRRPLIWVAAVVCLGLLLTPHLYGLRNTIYGRIAAAMQSPGQENCSDGWYITGYFVPREDELPGDPEQIDVERVGSLSFSDDFLEHTRTEGWGITRFGWALGYYDGRWHRSDSGPLDAAGKPLAVGMIAIDRSLIPTDAAVRIATLPDPWAGKTFRASDIGVGIVGQHIDVFTGMGSAAEQETFRITSENNRVCFANAAAPAAAPQ
jgi:3D (Asp-Asp-Asp) domain-containing protein